ncbi:disease resistance protein RPM1-like [Oryza brachyantha]|uniref:disease resistance protein RPM1-like n=1 Tax=Oryza brachyantha TaxID=4533 RepID=UPI0007762040|nr:disease resistance protein RPM1-like [Oryza brachyantha]
MAPRSRVQVVHNHLKGKKCILILDDVWGPDVWFKIKDVFPSDCVEPLQEHLSLELFCKEAFWKIDSRECPSELRHFGQKFVEKSNGLPIAIACIARLLSCRHPTYSEWENVSLEDLPNDLKNCFLHCALFPEDYLIKRKRVIWHWISAGFIREKENRTLEEVADGYLNDLVNRSLLQVIEKNEDGRVQCCRMHDVIHLLALHKADKECFGKIYDGLKEISVDGTRQLSIQCSNIKQLSVSGPTQHLREIHVSSNLHGAHIRVLPTEVFNLFNLRLLGLGDTGVEILQKEIGRLQNLEVLDAFTSIPAITEAEALIQLRTFGISSVRSEHSRYLCSAVMKMSHLVYLSITVSDENETLKFKELQSPQSLCELRLEGQLEKKSMPPFLSSWSHLKNVTKLHLKFSRLDQGSFSNLTVLRGLYWLDLAKAFEGKELQLYAGSFPKLRYLAIWDAPHLQRAEIEKGF